MLNWIHSHTTYLGPAISLHSEFVVSITSLEKGLLSSPSTGNLPNHCSAATWNNLLSTRWEFDPGSVVIRIVTNNNGIVPRTPSENPTISNMVFDVTHHSSFGNGSQGQHVPNDKGGLLPAVDELAGVHALGGDEELVLLLVSEGVAEADSGKRGTATRVVDDLGDDALEVAVALAEVEAAEPGGALAVVGVGLEDGPSTLTLSSDYTTH